VKKLIIAVIAIWGLVIAAAVGTGIVLLRDSDAPTEEAGPTDDPAEEPEERDLEYYYGQVLDWTPCGGSECAQLEVPLDYSDPSGDSIELALQRRTATGERVGSLVVNPGGPGAPGTVLVDIPGYFEDELYEAFDIVGFDPRGTGNSHPVDCITDEEMDVRLAQRPVPRTPEQIEEYADANRSFWEGCLELTGDLLAHVSTIETARDMDVLRAALDEEQLHYLGISYGTELGATYAELFPEQVGRFVLDSAVDPSLDFIEDALSQARGFERALRSYIRNCVDDGDCILGDSVGAGLRTLTALWANLEDDPLPTSDADGRELTVGYGYTGVLSALYSERMWSLLTLGLQQALEENDGTGLLQLADNYAWRDPGGRYDPLMEAFPSIRCLDDPSSIPIDEVEQYVDDFLDVAPTLGESWAWSLASCADFPVESAEEPVKISAEGAAPIMVLGITRDPATPYEEAVALAELLDSGFLVTLDGDGHGAYSSGNPCIVGAVHDLLVEGKTPDDTLTC
jgi:pimeloyl-ACP methyl ester carboxylesterase